LPKTMKVLAQREEECTVASHAKTHALNTKNPW